MPYSYLFYQYLTALSFLFLLNFSNINVIHLINANSVIANSVTSAVARPDISFIAKKFGIILIVKRIPRMHKAITLALYLFSGLIILYSIKNPPVKNR